MTSICALGLGFLIKKNNNFDIYMQTKSAAIQRRKRIIAQYT